MARLKRIIDPYLLLLLATIGLAAVLPAHGMGAVTAGHSTTIAVGALFFLYGARLSPQAIWEGMSHWRLQSLVLVSSFVLFPLVGLAVAGVTSGWLPVDLATGLLFLCLLPSTVQSSIAFTSIAGGNVPAALCSASVSNLLGVVLTPLLASLLIGGGGTHVSLGAIEDIALQILLPFVAGQIARPVIGGWLLRNKLLMSVVDRGSILLVVYTAFSEGVVAGIWTQVSPGDLAAVFTLDILILAIVMVATTVASRRLGFSKPDEIAIVFCGSKKSMASGVPMAVILFPAHSASLIVLPLMLFHQIQLFVCATLARRYARRHEALATRPAEAVART